MRLTLQKVGDEPHRSSNENASATGLLDSLLSSLGEKLGLDDHGDLGEVALTEDLEKSLIDD